MLSVAICLIAGFWTETRPSDFMDGRWDDILYVSRRLAVESANPSDSGAVEFIPRFDANRDGYCDLVSANRYIPLRIWFGGPTGYSSSNARDFPTNAGGNCDMADLNLDGWPELIHSGHTSNRCQIYWGSQSMNGPDPDNYTLLPNDTSESVYIYDIDKDSYLDIILTTSEWVAVLLVYWGGPGGYAPGNSSSRNDIKVYGHNMEVADLNKDGYPDIISPRARSGAPFWGVTVLWGDGDRDLTNNQVWYYEELVNSGPHGLTIADFNKDGWLDIVITTHAGSPTCWGRVFFSQNGSFDVASSIPLKPAGNIGCYGGSSAYDFDRDGWLDLLLFRGGDGSCPLIIYRNLGTLPYFSESDTVSCGPTGNYTGGVVCDLNLDGRPEVFANGKGTVSYVVWGLRPSGAYDSVQVLSVNFDHHGMFREPGNTYDRSPMAWYESGVFSSVNLQNSAILSWISWDSVQIDSRVRMYIRTRWDPVSPWSAWREVTNGELVNEAPYFPARDIQYRAEFTWQNPAWLPWLEKVQLETSPLETEEAGEDVPGRLTYGSRGGLIWVSWPGKEGNVSLYSADGRRVAESRLTDGRTEFVGLTRGVYYLFVKTSDTRREKVIVR